MNDEWILEWSDGAIRDMRRIGSSTRQRIIDKIEQYAANPVSLSNQVITLTGTPYRRLRVGDYRVIFSLEGGKMKIMVIVRVRHRSEAYD